jgi:hypothetical protein
MVQNEITERNRKPTRRHRLHTGRLPEGIWSTLENGCNGTVRARQPHRKRKNLRPKLFYPDIDETEEDGHGLDYSSDEPTCEFYENSCFASDDPHSFHEVTFRQLLPIIRNARNREKLLGIFLALEFSGNSKTAQDGKQISETLFQSIEKIIRVARPFERVGYIIIGATTENISPLRLFTSDNVKNKAISELHSVRDDIKGSLCSVSVAIDLEKTGRLVAEKKISFTHRIDLKSLIMNNWCDGSVNQDPFSIEVASSELLHTDSYENETNNDTQSLNNSTYELVEKDEGLSTESNYDMLTASGQDECESWITNASDYSIAVNMYTWDELSDVDSVISLDTVNYSYADMVRLGSLLSVDTKKYSSILHKIDEDKKVNLEDSQLWQHFWKLEDFIDYEADLSDSLEPYVDDVFYVKYKRRGRMSGIRPDGKLRWKRYK